MNVIPKPVASTPCVASAAGINAAGINGYREPWPPTAEANAAKAQYWIMATLFPHIISRPRPLFILTFYITFAISKPRLASNHTSCAPAVRCSQFVDSSAILNSKSGL